jgi:adhesin/invasin
MIFHYAKSLLFVLALIPARAQTAAVAHLAVAGGNGQVACQCSTSTLPAFQPISVKAMDANGNPVAGATVTWTVTSGQATVGSAATATDANGVASNTVTLVSVPNQATASTPYLVSSIQAIANNNSVTFTETQSLLLGGNSDIQADPPTFGGASLNQAALSAPSGAMLSTPIQVHVASGELGSGVPNVSVRLFNAQSSPGLSCAAQGGYADPGSVLTDSNGDANCYPLLGGSGAGSFNVLVGGVATASVSGAAQALQSYGPYTFTSIPGSPEAVLLVSGNNQVGSAEVPLNPLVARLVDANGNAVQNQTMVWTVTPAAAATLSSAQTVTGNNGLVSATPVLHSSASGGVQVSVALASNRNIEATFQLTLTGSITSLTKLSGDAQSALVGTTFAAPLVVQVNGAGGPIANYPVQFSSTGPITVTSGTTVATDAAGHAAVTVKAGAVPGAATVTAVAGQLNQTFTLTVTNASAVQPNGITIVSGNNQSTATNTAFAVPLVVQVNSLAGPVANYQVSLSVTGPVTISATSVTTNASGQAQVAAQAGSTAGNATVTASISVGTSTFSCTFALTVIPGTTANTTAVPIFGTGHLAGKSDLAAPGSVDGNFKLISCPTGAACVSDGNGADNAYVTLTGQYPFPNWLPNTSSAQWIGPAKGGNEATVDSPGVYVYRETFDLTGFNLSTVTLTGSFAIDDALGTIQLNGVTVGPTSTTFASTTPFTLTAGFVAGKNTIDFVVTNGPTGGIYNPTGLFVELSGTGSLAVSVPPPTITTGGIVPVDSPVGTIQTGEWVSIYGANLASTTAIWNGNFPGSLGGTSVTVDGKTAYLWYVSPTQINLQVPDDPALGTVPVVVTTAGGTAASTVTMATFAPSFLLADNKHVSGIILRPNGSGAYGGGSYDILGPTGASLGYPTVAAKAGDLVALYALGLGPTKTTVPAGQAFSGAAQTTSPVTLLINNVGVSPSFVGLVSAGLYQINLTVPTGLGTGDVSLVAFVETAGGAQTQSNVVISLQ